MPVGTEYPAAAGASLDAKTFSSLNRSGSSQKEFDLLDRFDVDLSESLPDILPDFVSDLAVRAGLSFNFFSWAYFSRFIFSLAFFLGCTYVNTLASVIAGHRTPWVQMRDLDGYLTPQYTLPDIGHEAWAFVLGKIGHSEDFINDYSIPDQLVFYLTVATFTLMSVHPLRFTILRRAVALLGTVFLIRAITVLATQLPDASPVCQAQFGDPQRGAYKRLSMLEGGRIFRRAWVFLRNPTKHVTCGDMVFSGHTSSLMICAMVFRRYCKGKWMRTKIVFRDFFFPEAVFTVVRWGVYCYVFFGSLLIIGTRLHYTLDVLIAQFTTYSVFTHYHTFLRYKRLRGKGMFIVRWFEAEEIIRIEAWAYSRAKEMD